MIGRNDRLNRLLRAMNFGGAVGTSRGASWGESIAQGHYGSWELDECPVCHARKRRDGTTPTIDFDASCRSESISLGRTENASSGWHEGAGNGFVESVSSSARFAPIGEPAPDIPRPFHSARFARAKMRAASRNILARQLTLRWRELRDLQVFLQEHLDDFDDLSAETRERYYHRFGSLLVDLGYYHQQLLAEEEDA